MDKKILNLYLSPDYKANIPYPFLYNSEYSFQTFIKNLPVLFNRKFLIGKYKKNTEIYLVISNFNCFLSHENYLFACFESKPYEIIIDYDIKILKIIKNVKGENITEDVITKHQNIFHQIKIPAYVFYQGKTPFGNNTLMDENTTGGFFIINKGIKKFMINKKDLLNVTPKFKKINKINHMSFSSIPCRFLLDRYKIQYFTLELVLSDKFKFNIQSAKTFIDCNILILITVLFKYKDVYNIYDLITKPFDDNIKEACKYIFEQTKELLINEYQNNIWKYITNQIKIYLKKQSLSIITNDDIINEFKNQINSFLPHLDNIQEKIYFLISITRQFIFATFQNEVYPNKDSLIGKRISPIGYTFEEIINTNLINFIDDIKFKFKTEENIDVIINNHNFNLKIINIFNNIFNMKDKKYNKIIKPSTGINAFTDIYMPNLVTHGSTIKLTKTLSSRNIEMSSLGFEDPIDTPDHSENVGLDKRISITTRITYMTFDEHKSLFYNLKTFILEFINYQFDNSKPIIVSIVDQSEFPICFMTKEEIDKFIIKLKHFKKNNYNNFRYIGIELIPKYKFNNEKQIQIPINDYFQLKLNISNKRYYKPVFVVENGKAVFETIKDITKYECFTDLINEYPNIIEFIDPAQACYSNICVSYNIFQTLSENIRNKYDYIDIPSYGNFGILAATTFDLGRMAGARGTFAVAQQKHVLTSPNSNIYNKFEAGSALLMPIERPCITNFILEQSGIAKYGRGHHIMVGFFSHNSNIEDGLIIRKKSIERGLLDAFTLNTFKSVCLDSELKISLSNKTNNNYSKLQKNGLPDINTVLVKGDAIHKRITIMFKDDKDYPYDISESYNVFVPGRVIRTEKTGVDSININILTSSYKPLNVGDKLCNQCAQKGTLAKIYDDIDLPCTKDGIYPDIIINSTSIISRQTFSLLILPIFTKFFAHQPYDEDNNLMFKEYSQFTNVDIEDVFKNIKEKYKKLYPNKTEDEIIDIMYCNHDMYNSFGEKLENKIMLCPLLYSRLIQMSIDKIAFRNGGKLNKFGLPLSGKKRGGGQRNGEMEMDNLISHCAANILHENTMDVITNDVYSKICSYCFTPATCQIVNDRKRWFCSICQKRNLITDINSYRFTQAFKIFKEFNRCRGIDILVKEKEVKEYYPQDAIN